MAYTGVETSVTLQVVDDTEPPSPDESGTLVVTEEVEISEHLFQPIKYTYECFNYDGRDFTETHAAPLNLEVVKEAEQLVAEEQSCVFEIETRVEVKRPRNGAHEDDYDYSLDWMEVRGINEAKMIIHSLPLLDAIREIVKYYPSQNLIGDKVTVHEPYMVLIHHIRELKELKARLESSLTADSDNRILEKCRHLQVLLDFLNLKFQRPLAQADKRLLKETPTVVFEDIWYLLKPGTLVYFLHDGLWLGGAIESVSRRSKDSDKKEAWIVNVLFQDVDFYKHALGRAPCCIIIEAFDGEKLVTSLPVLPCQFHDRQDNGTRRAAFQKRGALVADIVWSGYKYMKYSGTTMDRKKKKYEGPIIIGPCDLEIEFPEHDWNFDWSPTDIVNAKTGDRDNRDPIHPTIPLDLNVDASDKSLLSDDHLLMMVPVMAAFALSTKTWEPVNIDWVTEMDKPDTIPDANTNPENLDIIKALSDRQIKTKFPWSADFIKDKGEGVVVLLHGPPGVGKTYTVESIAINTGRPLMSLTIADLGAREDAIETNLTKWFALAQKWRAILLLDEADIFLERREHKDLARNGIVSAFLRKMEFFRGLLFLTTNRVGHIDEAFISRVHVIIGFEKLDSNQRKKIWKSFLDKLRAERKGQIRVTPACTNYVLGDEMSSMEWNGREIRNALQTAIALAEYDLRRSEDYEEGMEITVEGIHFQKVMKMSRSFREYMNSIQRDTEEYRATKFYGRNDYFRTDNSSTATQNPRPV
ncbi:ATPase family AAA domain-containing protein 3B [Aspergillus udagawae]|uniref:ATPase family AAA domain-containing protein 3B n=1 Tax=Aspergillus udagawae TaxID=91492 RepID=A0A8H3N784_9EURO|nr:ATPase family AAA domain-containing protein 3B [Aspergillus udagawae]GFF28312.1 ATPase family AAA domain-containing protein 3B [Aspergillus udagawae]GFF31348.1 ATPase family AAA domain-containing protein 3B [Aspergillus udagawae]GFF70389.1 ATPase family AAA domain-containing protein 3B [Aspergillus udagawae]